MDLLDGIRVISFNHFLVGPAGAQILADLGADVIMVEPLEGSHQRRRAVGNLYVDGQPVNFLCVDRNKRSIALDLRSEAGKEIARKLVAKADVIMENYRPGAMDRLGLGYRDVQKINPRIIFASATGFGADGPYRDRPGQDLIVQALSGLAAITGRADGPPTPVGCVAVDHHAAALFAMGILAALVARERTGKGRRVEVSLLSAALDLQFESLSCYLNGGRERYLEGDRARSPRGPGNIAQWFSPAPYGVYATRDGHIALSSAYDLKPLADALDLPELAAVAPAEAFSRREEVAEKIKTALARESTAYWVARLTERGIWHAPVQDYEGVRNDPQVRHNGSFATVEGATGKTITLVTHPVRYDGSVPPIKRVPQPLGAQTREVLRELGYQEEEIEALETKKTVRAHEPGPE